MYKKKLTSIVFGEILYEDKNALCDAFGVNINVFLVREKKGWELEACLGIITESDVIETMESSFVFEGCLYEDANALAKAYGISGGSLKQRLSYGWTLKCALDDDTNAVYETPVIFNGVRYKDKHTLCAVYNRSVYKFRASIRVGRTIQQALGLEEIPLPIAVADYEDCGKTYVINDETYYGEMELCAAYDICIQKFRNRINCGWTVANAIK